MFQLLGYNVTAGAADANVDMTAMVDPNFSRRLNHYILTEQYKMIAAIHQATSATRLRFNIPSINGILRHNVYPPNRSATMPSNPQIQDLRDYPLTLPMNEEISLEESNDAGGAEQAFAFLWLAPMGWAPNIPRGVVRLTARFTATIVVSASAWSADASITFSDPMKGGSYAVVGCQAFGTSLLAFRLNFPKPTSYNNRKLLPGDLGTNALGNVPLRQDRDWLGEWGRFNSFELPQLSVCSLSGGATAIVGYMDLVYLGESMAA